MTTKLACACVLGLLLFWGCSDSGTDPVVDDPPDDVEIGGLMIGYTSDPSRRISGDVFPETGGTVTATGSNGVTYSLDVPPGAIDSPHTLSITPLISLSISRQDSTSHGGSDCLQGALFEPSGLVFDLPAVLTITYPGGGLDCPLTSDLRIVSIDSTSSSYEIIPTLIDAGSSTLVCSLSHFSGYGADNASDYDFLKYLIQETTKAGTAFPGYDVVIKLVSYAKEADLNGWTDLKTLAMDGARPVLAVLVDGAVRESQVDPGASTMLLLQKYYDLALWFDFSDIQTNLLNAMDGVTRAVAAQGQAQCAATNYSAGQTLLKQALAWAMQGLANNAEALIQDIDGWMSDCGEVVLSVSCSGTTLRDVALTAEEQSTFTTFDVMVTSFQGEPLEGENVDLNIRSVATGAGRKVDGGTTGADGKLRLRYSYGPWQYESSGSYRAEIVCREQKEELSLSLLRTVYTVRLTWDYSYSNTWDTGHRTASASYSAVGTGTHSTDPDCAHMTRSFTSSHQYQSGNEDQTYNLDLVDSPTKSSCIFSILSSTAYEMIDGISTRISRLSRADVSVQSPHRGGLLINVASGPESFTDTLTTFDLRTYYDGTYFPDEILSFTYAEGSGFDGFTWEKETTDGNGSGNLAVTISVDGTTMNEAERKKAIRWK